MKPQKETSIPEQLDEHGLLLHKLFVQLPDHPAITDTFDYVLGALYGLVQANQIGFKDRSTHYVSVYRPHLANYALTVSTGHSLDSVWTAGFHFNSGIQRLASAFDRLPRMLGAKMKTSIKGKVRPTTAKERMAEMNPNPYQRWEKVYDEVNTFKHSPEGRAAGRTVTINDAVVAFGEMMRLISDRKAELAKRYGP
jgi:hypothetical protein